MNENTPVIIGRYRLSKTLGIGAFGKVKCEQRVARLHFAQIYNIRCVFALREIEQERYPTP